MINNLNEKGSCPLENVVVIQFSRYLQKPHQIFCKEFDFPSSVQTCLFNDIKTTLDNLHHMHYKAETA